MKAGMKAETKQRNKMATTQQTYKVTKSMSDFIFSDPSKLEKALKQSIKMAKREKQIRNEFNKLNNETR
jgi:hypothetical protein